MSATYNRSNQTVFVRCNRTGLTALFCALTGRKLSGEVSLYLSPSAVFALLGR